MVHDVDSILTKKWVIYIFTPENYDLTIIKLGGNTMEKALIVVDVQKDYFEGGRNELVHAKEATGKVKKLIDAFRAKDEPVIYIQHINTRPGATFFIAGTDGIDISELIAPKSTDIIVEKHYPNSFLETTLQKHLNEMGVKKLVICGMMTHMCIDTTVRAAKGLGYEVTLVEDACATKNLVWNGELISAEVVQKVFMASLNGSFASICQEKDLNI